MHTVEQPSLQSCFKTLPLPKRAFNFPSTHQSPLPPHAQASTELLSVSRYLPFLDMSHQWDHTVCGPLHLACFHLDFSD